MKLKIMKEFFLPAGIIMLFFSAFWHIRYPQVMWNVLMFRHRDSGLHILVAILVWIYLVGAVTTLSYLVNEFL